jgi:ribonuclease HI
MEGSSLQHMVFMKGVVIKSPQGTPSVCGSGVVLYLNEHHWLKFKEGLGEGTNTFVELRALKLLLHKDFENGCISLQVYGDSMVIINRENGMRRCHNLILFPILEKILLIKQDFDSSITHV